MYAWTCLKVTGCSELFCSYYVVVTVLSNCIVICYLLILFLEVLYSVKLIAGKDLYSVKTVGRSLC